MPRQEAQAGDQGQAEQGQRGLAAQIPRITSRVSQRPSPTTPHTGKQNRAGGSTIKEQGSHQSLYRGKGTLEVRKTRGEAEKEKSEEKATAAHLVHQGGEGKRSG